MTSKNLFCVPLIGDQVPEDLANKYWTQIGEQIETLQRIYGNISSLYHEANDSPDDEGLRHLKAINQKGFQFIRKVAENGGKVEALEDRQTFLQIIDCQVFLSLGFLSKEISQKVASITGEILEAYKKAVESRRRHIVERISQTLKEGQTGLLMINDDERMQLQFPSEINVILVRPPLLSEIERWEREKNTTVVRK